MSEIQIGERQTVQRAKHPTMGEGRLVYDNGPAFFVADSGEVEHYRGVRSLGWSAARDGRPERHECEGIGCAGATNVAIDILGRTRGPTHMRIVAQDGRPGWLVQWSDDVSKRERFIWHRFDPDGGAPETMMVQRMWAGEARHKARPSIDSAWSSVESIGGHGFTFRRECDHVPVGQPRRGAKKAPVGTMPGPGATRAEIDAWKAGAA